MTTTWLDIEQTRYPVPPVLPVPTRFEGITLGDLPDNLRSVSERYLAAFRAEASRGIAPIMLGRARTWKTAATYALLQEIRQRFTLRCHVLSCPTDLMFLEFDRFNSDNLGFLRNMCAMPVLAIDDFATVKVDSIAQQLLSTILTERHKACYPTIWNGNLVLPAGREFEAIGVQYGAHFARRLEDGGKGYTVLLS